jgi:hypothetical protein
MEKYKRVSSPVTTTTTTTAPAYYNNNIPSFCRHTPPPNMPPFYHHPNLPYMLPFYLKPKPATILSSFTTNTAVPSDTSKIIQNSTST